MSHSVDNSGLWRVPAGTCTVGTADVLAHVRPSRERLAKFQMETYAAALAHAAEVLEADSLQPRCLGCGAQMILERVIVLKTRAVGLSESSSPRAIAGLCPSCVEACSSERAHAVRELVTATQLVDSMLTLIRHRADRALSSWWGGLGNVTPMEINDASVRARRAIERLGVR